MINHVMK